MALTAELAATDRAGADGDMPHPLPSGGADPSLTSDVNALFTDAKTYLQAEVAFQKSRAGYAAGEARAALVFGVGALAFFHLALIAFTVGLLFALSTVVGPWLAMAIVVLALLGGAAIMAMLLRNRAKNMQSVFGTTQS